MDIVRFPFLQGLRKPDDRTYRDPVEKRALLKLYCAFGSAQFTEIRIKGVTASDKDSDRRKSILDQFAD